jgi:hypothetical protein
LDQRIDASRVNAAASVLVAAGTMALAFVTFYQIQTTRRQSLETQQAQVRPLLVPQSEINAHATLRIWSQRELIINLKNVGAGVAVNIWGVILPPNEVRTDVPPQFNLRAPDPIANGDKSGYKFQLGGSVFTGQERIGQIELGAPKGEAVETDISELNQMDRRDRYVARLTLSYEDIYGLKHASIYSLTSTGAWVCTKVLSNISESLRDFDLTKGYSSK